MELWFAGLLNAQWLDAVGECLMTFYVDHFFNFAFLNFSFLVFLSD